MTRTFKRFPLVLALAMGAIGVGAGSLRAATLPAVDDCEALPTMDFTSIQDAPTQVTAVRMVEAGGEVPARRVRGRRAQVRIVVRLPNSAAWS